MLINMRRQQIIAQNNEYKRIVAPRDWKPSDEEVDIIQVFNSHRDTNKKFIVLISNEITTYTLVSSFYYTINERIGGVDVRVNLPTGNTSFTFTAGSTHRWIIGCRSNLQNSPAYADIGSVWLHCSKNVYWLNSINNNITLRVITSESLNSIYEIRNFLGNTSLNGELNLTTHINYINIGDRTFRDCSLTGTLVLPRQIRQASFSGTGESFVRCNFTGTLVIHSNIINILNNTFGNNEFTKIDWYAPLQEEIVNFNTLGALPDVTSVTLFPDKRGIAWSWSINISGLLNLNAAALVNIFNSLLDLNTIGLPARTITIGTTNLNKLSQAEKDIALNKGYTLA